RRHTRFSRDWSSDVCSSDLAQIDYLKPGQTSLYFSVHFSTEQIDEAYSSSRRDGKVVRTFLTEVYDKNGALCAVSHNEVYIRDLSFVKPALTNELVEHQNNKS